MTRRLAALIFDVDGTLAETEEMHRCAFNEAFAAFDLDWHWDVPLYADLLRVTGGKERIGAFIRAHHRPGMDDMVRFIPAIHARKTSAYGTMMDERGIALRPGIGRLIEEARSVGLRLAIATTTSRANVVALLRAAVPQLDPESFDVIAAGDEVAHKKPDPAVYRAVLGALGLPASHCVAIEDSRNGLLAAQAAGIATIVTPSRFTQRDDFSGALAVMSDLGEPHRAYRHETGAGREDTHATPASIERWLASRPAKEV